MDLRRCLHTEQESQCEAEEDTVWSIQWDTTDEGDTNEQDCPRPDEQQQEVIGMLLYLGILK